MNEKPIIFSAPMVRAILEGRKTQTRRVGKNSGLRDKFYKWVTELNGKPFYGVGLYKDSNVFLGEDGVYRVDAVYFESRFKPGDLLWVREKYRLVDFSFCDDDWNASVQYAADQEIGDRLHYLKNKGDEKTGWRSPIHMPRCASRVTLRVTGVRCERVQDITAEDCIAEGCHAPYVCRSESGYIFELKTQYKELWDGIHKKDGYGWDANPWVWVIGFEVLA